jgi:hypothetical protein
MNILEVCPIIRLCRVLGSVRLGRSVTEGPFPKNKKGCVCKGMACCKTATPRGGSRVLGATAAAAGRRERGRGAA